MNVHEFGSGKKLGGTPSENLVSEWAKKTPEFLNAYFDSDDCCWRYVRPEDVDMFTNEYEETVVMVYLE